MVFGATFSKGWYWYLAQPFPKVVFGTTFFKGWYLAQPFLYLLTFQMLIIYNTYLPQDIPLPGQ